MPNSTCSSAASARSLPRDRTACSGAARIDWWPSRWLTGAIMLLGASAGCALLASDLSARLAWPAAVLAWVYGAWLLWREHRRSPHAFVFRAGAAPLVDGEPAVGFQLHWRGPLAFASWCDARGRRQHRAWWPDTLPAPQRRELRLAAPTAQDASRGASMAP
ncbi:hypothetical protein ACW5EG_05995 [Luteimonas sp. A611]